MRNSVGRGLLALGSVLALVMALPASTAVAGDGATTHVGDRVCSMYVNSNGFGAYCSNAGGTSNGKPKSWRDLMDGPVFIPCRDFPVPNGITLPEPPEGKVWKLRLTIVDYDLDQPDGGRHSHLERAIVPLSEAELRQCPDVGYMDIFWNQFHEGYPSPVLLVNPTYTPRVNVPAFFGLPEESAYIFKVQGGPEKPDSLYYAGGHNLTMRGVVDQMEVDPGDGTKPIKCLMGVAKIGDDGYDETSDPFHQLSTCKHVYKRSSANQPEGMYTVKLTIHWQVDYWLFGVGWKNVGAAEVHAVQRLPVQEVQAIGG